MYEQRINRNMDHIEQLLKEKEQQNIRKSKFIEKKKKFEQTKKKMKQKFDEDVKANKEKWGQ